MSPLLRRLARRLGYDLTPVRKAKAPAAQRAALLERHGVTCVLDVGANVGQYALALRARGYRGRIVSFEPVAAAHDRLRRRAARDPMWTVAPRMALGEGDGEAEVEVSAESDMSSLLPQSDTLRRVSPSSRVVGRERVPLRRLDGLFDGLGVGPAERPYLKLDVQGAEPRVLEGARGVLPRLVGIELEMALVPCYEGERDWRETIDALARDGFELRLLLPGYFERKLGRQLQVDGVFYRPDTGSARAGQGFDAAAPAAYIGALGGGSRPMRLPENLETVLVPIHRAGWPFVALFLVAAALLGVLWPPLFWLGLIATFWCGYFFRDPARVTPEAAETLVVSPADGVVQSIRAAPPPPELGLGAEPRTCVSVFMNVFDVHVNRAPVTGTVTGVAYHPGRFYNASLDKASTDNERQSIRIRTDDGEEVGLVQIAGLVARRIVRGVVAEGRRVAAGERVGMIRFGSRCDVYLPHGLTPLVVVGQRAVAGETVLADGARRNAPPRTGRRS